jgi:hypothetical protein
LFQVYSCNNPDQYLQKIGNFLKTGEMPPPPPPNSDAYGELVYLGLKAKQVCVTFRFCEACLNSFAVIVSLV